MGSWGLPAHRWLRVFSRSQYALAASGPVQNISFPDRLFYWEAMAPAPDTPAEPYSLQWYLTIEAIRLRRQARWLRQLLEFDRHAGEVVVGLGDGLGTDWVQYAQKGARVIACCPAGAQAALVRRNFELRGLTARCFHADPTCLPVASESADVVCIEGLLHEMPREQPILHEVQRILKPGGKILAVLPARPLFGRGREKAHEETIRSPWFTARRRAEPLLFSRRELLRLFQAFARPKVYRRHLKRKDLPRPWRWIPPRWLERFCGRYLVFKGFKPLASSAALAEAA